ncbi:MAG TPA: efflux RND transporter permease subunit [Candidatus Acidoferrales bacterium]|nr:efflux RND transporter permease subunit [Candidatus Acidoferrales bacterium]
MSLTRLFLKRPTLTFVFVTLTCLVGIFALRSLVVQQSPNTGLPTINVQVSYSGASTTELQTEVAEPLEDQIAGTPYLDHIDTTIENGSVSISASFALNSTDTENIANVEKALQAAQRQLPSAIQAPTIRVANPSEPNILSLSLTSKKYTPAALGALANNQIIPAIEQYPGVSQASVYGTTQAAFEVLVNPNLLAADNLTLSDVVNAISPNNIRAPGGIIYQPGRETQIDVRGDIFDTQSLANLPIHVAYSGTSANTSGTGGTGSTSTTSTASSGGGAATGASSTNGTESSGSTTGSGTGTTSSATSGTGTTSSTTSGTGTAGSTSGSGATNSATSGVGTMGSTTSGTGSSTSPGSSTSTGSSASQTGTTSATTSGTGTAGSTSSGSTTTTTATAPPAVTPPPAPASAGINSRASAQTGGSSAATPAAVGYFASGVEPSTTTTLSASANPPVDTSVNVGSVSSTANSSTSTTAQTASEEAAALPSATSSEYGSGSGTSLSPFVGILNPWAVPSTDKRISDVAQVINGSVVQRVFATLDGKPGVGVQVQKATTASEVTVANEIIAALPTLRAQFPGINFIVSHNQSTFTEQQLQSVEHTLIEGIILTALVMLFFLKSWRNAVVVMIAIPTSLGVTLFGMKLLNLTLDTISLMAMTLVIGILIDDSTVVLENIERHRSMGEAPADAALNGRSEIGLAAIVITMVDVVVFLPIAFAGGQVGVQLAEFGIVVSIATLTSLFVSFTVTPVLAGLWSMKSEWKPWGAIVWFDDRFNGLRTRYTERWLPSMMDRPWPIVIVSIVLCVLAYLLVPTGLLGEEYEPVPDQGIIDVLVTLAPGHPLAQTRQLMANLEAKTRQTITGEDFGSEQTVAGGYQAEFGGFIQEGNVGQIFIYLSTNHKTPTATYVTRLQAALTPLAPPNSLNIVQSTQQGGGVQQPIDELVGVTNGSDPTGYAAKVYQALQQTPGAVGAQDSATNAAPQVEVDFDRAKLQALDVSVGTAAAAVEAAFGGDQATQIETPQNGLTEILVEYPLPFQNSLAALLNIPIRSQDANADIVRLGDVAHLYWAPAPLIITRENRQEVVHVSANVANGYNLSDVTKAFLKRVKALHLPRTVTVHPAAAGQQDLMNQALVTLGSSLAISIVLVFLMIVALYNSYRTPFVTLFAIPLATIGAFGALWITRQTLNLYSLIGMVLLVGLVTKNGILLVDYADTVRAREGKSREDGMREAAATRFRPIMMTTIAMVAGMLPLALGLEPGGQSRASLAIAVIGGLLSSLVLTLFIVPIMYSWVAPKELKPETEFADEKRPPQAPPQQGAPAPA